MKEFSSQTRKQNISKLKDNHFDLLIIGGGITGAGVARDASMRGLKVALIEANDFAFGTSSRSSKLIHGGIRYLENYEFHLVFEALSERAKLFEIAPHLAHPLRFMIPLFKDSRVGPFKMGLGMILYDVLALFQTPEIHEKLNRVQTLNRMPIVRSSDLVGSFVYSDGYMDDDRLVHETLRSANEFGAVAVNYVKAKKSFFEDGKISSVEAEDLISKENFEISCDHVVSTVGPWTDLVGPKMVDDWKDILRPTKGIHLTLHKDRLPLTSAVVMAAQKGPRIIFAIPRHEMIIIGTTDTDFEGNPEDAKVTAEDVTYLLQITNEYFPGALLTTEDIISTYVGVRPLVKDDSNNENKTSREHTIISDARGFTFVAGGKYTTYRLMSEQIVDKVLKTWSIEDRMSVRHCQTNSPLNHYTSVESYHLAKSQAATENEKLLVERYGLEGFEILAKYGQDLNYWQLEAFQAIQTTMCLNLVDFFARRVPLVLAYRDHGLSLLEKIATVFEQELNWSSAETEKQKKLLKDYIDSELSWRKSLS
ncbi:MAG: glycerol-3-phosphate dehydrogenase/oxidase [Bdellovibrio sp.]|nr:glycerol-3-phosphate dehydrogenase/oxidase [Bdellovibrio sp.]